MKLLVRAWVLFFMAICVVGQTLPRPEFEVVSVKTSPAPVGGQGGVVSCTGGPGTRDPGMYHCTHMVLANLIMNAYGIPRYRLSGPDWMTRQQFEITARVPAGATRDDLKLMLQSMLAHRFKLAVHHETREMPKYDLVVAKGGPKLHPPMEESPQGSLPPDPGSQPKRSGDGYPTLTPGVRGMAIDNRKARMFNPKMGLDQLASMLGGQLGKPVTNATGLEGSYAISLYWVVASVGGAPGGAVGAGAPVAQEPEGPMIEQAIQQQLGLKLEARKGPVDFIVVDHLEKMPLEN